MDFLLLVQDLVLDLFFEQFWNWIKKAVENRFSTAFLMISLNLINHYPKVTVSTISRP